MEINSQKLYFAMANANITQTELAKRANVSSRTVTTLLKGGKCRSDVLGRVSKALEIAPQELVD